jgi:amino-acid N-acetyltransferase
MKIRDAQPSDLQVVAALLSANDLPVDGVAENFSSFIVAEDTSGIAGAIGLENYGSCALLRSAVVGAEHRGSGVGRRLVEAVLERAKESGVEEIYLLTTTAEEYFPRFGFQRTSRSVVPAPVTQSVEFKGACCETATVMMRSMRDEADMTSASAAFSA